MSTSGKMELKGLDEYLENLVRAGQDIDAAAARALERGGDIVLQGMLDLVPVGEAPQDPHPGQLKAHLHRTKPVFDGIVIHVEVGVFEGESLPDADLARYANAQEYGYTRGGKYYSPRSYIRGGIDSRRKAALAAMKQSLIDDGML